MSVPREVRELIERFRRNEDVYRSGQYNETQLRREFIGPFFAALGWQVTYYTHAREVRCKCIRYATIIGILRAVVPTTIWMIGR